MTVVEEAQVTVVGLPAVAKVIFCAPEVAPVRVPAVKSEFPVKFTPPTPTLRFEAALVKFRVEALRSTKQLVVVRSVLALKLAVPTASKL